MIALALLLSAVTAAQAQFGAPIKRVAPSPFKSARGPHDQQIDLTGSQFVYDRNTDTFIANGDAHMTQGTSHLTGDLLRYDRRNHLAFAEGNVHFDDPTDSISASRAEIDSDDETGKLYDAKLSANLGTYYLAGKEITKLTGQRYSVSDGYFTTCGCESGTPSWTIGGKQIDIHMGGSGTARDSQFRVLGYPVLDIPYLIFPADTTRQSGLLSPRIGTSHTRGFQYVQPFYWDISKSQDATIALDVESSARAGAFAEYRIMNGPDDYVRFTGGFLNESLRAHPDDIVDTQLADAHVPINRLGLIGDAREHLTDSLLGYADTVTTSDNLYLRDINVYSLSHGYGSNFTSLRTGDTHFGLIQSYTDGYLKLGGTWTQDYIQQQDYALQTLPEALLSGRYQILHNLAFADYDVQADNFWRTKGVQGQRLDIFPRLTIPFRIQDYVTGFATLAARETVYDVSGHSVQITPIGSNGQEFNNALSTGVLGMGGSHSRQMIYGSAGASTVIERIYKFHKWGIKRLKHTVEPNVGFNYVPKENQNSLPLFDEVDRINSRRLLNYGVVSRLYAQYDDQGDSAARQAYDDDQESAPSANNSQGMAPFSTSSYTTQGRVREVARFSLLQAYDTGFNTTPSATRTSDVEANASFFASSLFTLGSQLGYDPRQQKVSYTNFSINIRPPWEVSNVPKMSMGRALVGGSFLQLGYNYVGGSVSSEAIFLRAYYELFHRFGLYYSPVYDVANHQMLSSAYGLRFKSACDCWSADFGVSDTFNPKELQYQIQITLGGLGSFGQNPFGRNPFLATSGPGLFNTAQY